MDCLQSTLQPEKSDQRALRFGEKEEVAEDLGCCCCCSLPPPPFHGPPESPLAAAGEAGDGLQWLSSSLAGCNWQKRAATAEEELHNGSVSSLTWMARRRQKGTAAAEEICCCYCFDFDFGSADAEADSDSVCCC